MLLHWILFLIQLGNIFIFQNFYQSFNIYRENQEPWKKIFWRRRYCILQSEVGWIRNETLCFEERESGSGNLQQKTKNFNRKILVL